MASRNPRSEKDNMQSDAERRLEQEMGADFTQTGDNPPTFVQTDSQSDIGNGRIAALERRVQQLEQDVAALRGDAKPMQSGTLDQYEEVQLVNDETGEMQTVRAKVGYAPPPVILGWRVITEEERRQRKE